MFDSVQRTAQMLSTQEPTKQNRDTLIQFLHQEYNRQLKHSLQGVAMIAVELHECTDGVRSSVQLVLHGSSTTEENPLPCSSIVEAYDAAGQHLLILGEPGAGKTTLLLELACELLTRAEDDPTLPIPVILNLSSWASQKPPLESWLVDQLRLVYNVPSSLSQAWLEQRSWLLLLDGLDEVEQALRPACIEAINTYPGEEHFTSLVVCSRSHEYLAQESQLAQLNAVVVQPLQEEQVTEYLEQLGESVAAIREVVRNNPTLRQLVTTPLMLHVIVLAYRNETAIDLPQSGSPEEQQRQVFARCTERRLEQRTAREQFTPQQTQHWLIWLAQQMKQHHLTEFYLEWLQPTWLSTERSQIQYRLFYMLIYGLALGLIYGLIGGLLGELIYGLVLGLVGGLLGGQVDDIKTIRPAEVLTWSWKAVWRGLFVGLDDIKTMPAVVGLRWSWNSVWQGGIVGLIVGLIGWLIGFGLIGGLIVGLIGGLIGWLIVEFVGGLMARVTYGLIGGVVREVSGQQIHKDMRIRPNRGIRGSGRKALCFGLIGGLIVGLIVGLIGGRTGGPVHGLILGVFLGVFLGILIAQIFGARAYICHYVLRYILYRNGAMPWHYVHFLEEATERTLLQRVGGGYRFIHPLFVDYLASQVANASPDPVEQPLQPLPQ